MSPVGERFAADPATMLGELATHSGICGEHKTVTDAAGQSWNTADIYETSALTAVYGMFFFALLAILRIT